MHHIFPVPQQGNCRGQVAHSFSAACIPAQQMGCPSLTQPHRGKGERPEKSPSPWKAAANSSLQSAGTEHLPNLNFQKRSASPVSQFTLNRANDNWQIPFGFRHLAPGVATDIQFCKFKFVKSRSGDHPICPFTSRSRSALWRSSVESRSWPS